MLSPGLALTPLVTVTGATSIDAVAKLTAVAAKEAAKKAITKIELSS
jgi:hypothetical protein